MLRTYQGFKKLKIPFFGSKHHTHITKLTTENSK